MISPTPGEAAKFATPADFEDWLEANHEQSPGIWLMIAKKGSTIRSITYPEAIEVALCFGWIDGQKARHDDQHWLQRFSPRSTRSRWSEINRGKAEELTAVGRMRPAGIAEVERAKADGRWEGAYKGQRTASIPRICNASSTTTPKHARHSPNSTPATATRSSGASTMPNVLRPANDASRST